MTHLICHPVSRAEVCWAIADAQVRLGDLPAARLSLQELISRGKTYSGWEWVLAASWGELGAIKACWGDAAKASIAFDQARLTTRDIEEPEKAAEAMADVAGTLVRAGRLAEACRMFDLATQAAATIEKSTDRDSALVTLARKQLAKGLVEQALRTANRLRDDHQNSFVLPDIALIQAQSGQAEAAKHTFAKAIAAGRSSQEGLTGDPFRDIAKYQGKVGHLHEAMHTAQFIRDPYWKAVALRESAEEVFQNGPAEAADSFLREAIKASNQVEDLDRRSENLAAITCAYAWHGQIEEANQMAETITDYRSRASAFMGIGSALNSDNYLSPPSDNYPSPLTR